MLGGEKRQLEKPEASAQLDSQNLERDNHHDFLNHTTALGHQQDIVRAIKLTDRRWRTSLERGTNRYYGW